jgi:hypothetical protein
LVQRGRLRLVPPSEAMTVEISRPLRIREANFWRNMGRLAFRRGLTLKDVLTGRSFSVDQRIREGFETERTRQKEASHALVR